MIVVVVGFNNRPNLQKRSRALFDKLTEKHPEASLMSTADLFDFLLWFGYQYHHNKLETGMTRAEIVAQALDLSLEELEKKCLSEYKIYRDKSIEESFKV